MPPKKKVVKTAVVLEESTICLICQEAILDAMVDRTGQHTLFCEGSYKCWYHRGALVSLGSSMIYSQRHPRSWLALPVQRHYTPPPLVAERGCTVTYRGILYTESCCGSTTAEVEGKGQAYDWVERCLGRVWRAVEVCRGEEGKAWGLLLRIAMPSKLEWVERSLLLARTPVPMEPAQQTAGRPSRRSSQEYHKRGRSQQCLRSGSSQHSILQPTIEFNTQRCRLVGLEKSGVHCTIWL